jgi:GST-like protein
MSRPTQYDRDIALDAAMLVFWEKGFHATSLKDLETALDMKPGSIYGAFSNKENLYLLALDRYFDRSVTRFRAHMQTLSSPLNGLAEHLRGFARMESDDPARQVCMLTRTLVDTAATNPEIAARTKQYLTDVRHAFAQGFERAKAMGELPLQADCACLARRFQGSVSALRFELHLGTDQAGMTSLAEELARDIEALRVMGSDGHDRTCRVTTKRKKGFSMAEYTPPKVWTWDAESGGDWAKINRPIAGATFEAELPVGQHPLQLYSMGTPNGQKVTIMLEELLAAGKTGAEYDAHLIRIGEGTQFSSGFVAVNPNSKIPAMVDRDTGSRVFESGSILLYLAEKFGAFLPTDPASRTEILNWVFWLQGSAPYLGGGFGHFYAYAPEKFEYPINRFTMEVKRQMDVLDRELAQNRYLGGDEYTIADMLTWPWYGNLVLGNGYNAGDFLDVQSYTNLRRWAQEILDRPAVQRGRIVNRIFGPLNEQLHERHDASDFDTKTQDKIAPTIA